MIDGSKLEEKFRSDSLVEGILCLSFFLSLLSFILLLVFSEEWGGSLINIISEATVFTERYSYDGMAEDGSEYYFVAEGKEKAFTKDQLIKLSPIIVDYLDYFSGKFLSPPTLSLLFVLF